MLTHQLTDMFSSSHSDEAACPTIITRNDDESFLHDGMELPASRLCKNLTRAEVTDIYVYQLKSFGVVSALMKRKHNSEQLKSR